MQKCSTRTIVAMTSVAALLLGGCATAAFDQPATGSDGSSYGASPSTWPPSASPAAPDPIASGRERYPEMDIQAP